MYDEPDNEAFINIIKSVALDITGAIRGTSKEKPYAKLDLEFLRFRQCFRKLASFHEIQSTGLPKYSKIYNELWFKQASLFFLSF